MTQSTPANAQEVRQAWLGLVAGLPFQIAVTMTSAKRTHPEAMLKRWRYCMNEVNRDLYGRNYQRHSRQLSWLVGLERHKSWNPHAHGVFFAPEYDLTNRDVFSYGQWQRTFTASGGFCQLQPIRNLESCVSYLTKYVIKDGDLEWSDNLKDSPSLFPNGGGSYSGRLNGAGGRIDQGGRAPGTGQDMPGPARPGSTVEH